MTDNPDTAVMAMGTRRNNAELMADCAKLGYLTEPVLDATYGLGRMWRTHTPTLLFTNDRHTQADRHDDFRYLSFADGSFGSVVFDPPYKLNGTSTGRGPSAADSAYGVGGDYVPVAERHRLIIDGIAECARVTNRWLLVKCADQVSSGKVWFQTRIFADAGEDCGLTLVDQLHVQGYRPQPAIRQVHARRDYSTLLVFRK